MFKAVVIGVSAGGLTALNRLFSCLKKDFSAPIIVVQHLHPTQNQSYIDVIGKDGPLPVIEAIDKCIFHAGAIYFAPPDYHLFIEKGDVFSLSVDEKINHCRPSIDALFESAADVLGSQVIGVILTGANNDGAEGLRKIKNNGGLTIVEDPATAESPYMPQAAIDCVKVDCVLGIDDIAKKLNQLC